MTAKPIPAITPDMRPFFEAAQRHELRVQRCRGCGALRFPARAICSDCLSTDADWVPVSGRGEIFSFNVMHQVYHPGFAAEVPYAVVLVKLAEGPKMISNLVGIDAARGAHRHAGAGRLRGALRRGHAAQVHARLSRTAVQGGADRGDQLVDGDALSPSASSAGHADESAPASAAATPTSSSSMRTMPSPSQSPMHGRGRGDGEAVGVALGSALRWESTSRSATRSVSASASRSAARSRSASPSACRRRAPAPGSCPSWRARR